MPQTKSEQRNQELISYYLSPHSLRETSKEFNISYQRVSKILQANNIKTHKITYTPQGNLIDLTGISL